MTAGIADGDWPAVEETPGFMALCSLETLIYILLFNYNRNFLA